MVQRALAQAAEELGIQLLRADDIFTPGVIMDQIRTAIETSEHSVVVCTGRNANVFYELGLADPMGHQPILLAAAVSDLPFDVSHRHRRRRRRLLEALRSANMIDGDQEAKRRILAAGSAFNSIYAERASENPSEASLASLEATRYEYALKIVQWMSPAAEYRGDRLSRRFPDIRWHERRPNDSGWVARLSERSEALASTLGYPDLASAKASYRELYPSWRAVMTPSIDRATRGMKP